MPVSEGATHVTTGLSLMTLGFAVVMSIPLFGPMLMRALG